MHSKTSIVEIAAYSTRYRRARQTTDDTNVVKFALASAGFASDVARMSPIFVLNEGYRARYTPLFDNVERLLPTGNAMRYSGPQNPGRFVLPPAVPAAMKTRYCCHDGDLYERGPQMTPVMAKHSLFRLHFNVPVSRTLCSPSSTFTTQEWLFPGPGNFQEASGR